MIHFRAVSTPAETAVNAATAPMTEPVMLFTWDMLPMPKEARMAKTAKRPASHCQPPPRPWEM